MIPQRVRLVAGVLGLGVTLLVAGCTDSSRDPAASGPSAEPEFRLSPDCPDPPARRLKPTVEELNAALGGRSNLPAWQAGDIGASARLSDGRIIWLFGDTTRPDLSPQLVANSMLVTSGKCVSQLLDEQQGPVIPDASPSVVRWPMSVAVARMDDHDTIIVLCSRIDRGNSGAFGFTYLGTTAAVFTVGPGAAPQLSQVVDITPDSRDEQQVNWGAASTIRGEQFFVFGTRLTGKEGVFGRELYVARGAASDPGNRGQWRFWDGQAWQRDPSSAVAVLPGRGGVSQTLSVDFIGGSFVAVSKRDGDVGNFVYKWTSAHPWGPWTPIEELEAPAGFDTGKLKYMPLAHPEVELASGDLLASVSRNTTDFEQLMRNPQVGRPEFIQLQR